MRHFISLFAVLIAALASVAQAAAVQNTAVLDSFETVFIPDPSTCKQRDICDLKSARFRVEQQQYATSNSTDPEIFSTRMMASYKTADQNAVRKYVYVQEVRGCVWSSRVQNGSVLEIFSRVRSFSGTRRVYRCADWTLDAPFENPSLSWDETTKDPYGFLEWSSPMPKTIPSSTKNFFSQTTSPTPEVYVVSQAENAIYSHILDEAQNTALEFRTCMYRVADIAGLPVGKAPDRARAITCIQWLSSYVYDHKKKRMVRQFMPPANCSRQPSAEELISESAVKYLDEKRKRERGATQ